MTADPWYINVNAGAPEYAADELRRLQSVLLTQAVGDRFGARSGVHPAGAPAVSVSGTTVTVEHLKAVVYPGLTTTAGPYIVALPAHTHPLTAADGANPRKDIVVLRIYDDDEDASTRREVVTELIAGTPAASPSEPAVPSGAVRLATIDVPQSGGGAATATYNAPYVVAAGGVLPVRNNAELTGGSAGLYDGMMRWNQIQRELQVHDGASTWNTLAGIGAVTPGTMVGYFQRTSAQLLDNSLAGASATAISWDTEIRDTLGAHDNAVNANRYTPTVAGWYVFNGTVTFEPNTSGGVRGCVWRLNGSTVDANVSRPHVGTIGNATITATAVTYTAAMNGTTDYVELAGVHDASVDLNTGTSGFRCSMVVTYGGPL